MIIDLSVKVNEDTQVYPGDPVTTIKTVGTFETTGFLDHYISMGTHAGTHIDAPAHMLPGGKTLDQMPLEQFIGPGRYIRFINRQFDFEVIKEANIKEGEIVLLHTGQSDEFGKQSYYENYPVLSEEMAKYFVEAKVKMIGLDTGGADIDESFPVHKILLSGDVLIIENLTNLSALDGKSFRVYALPLNLALDASPARVIAVTTD